MTGNRAIAACALLGLVAAAVAWLAVKQVTPLRRAELWLEDLRVANFPIPRPRSDVVVLAFNEDTIARFPYRSPINRAYLAGLVDDLAGRNVRALGMDFIFDQPTTPEEDRVLLESLGRFPKPVVIATGTEANGLTPRQLQFQDEYLAGLATGLASMLIADGTVREIYPGEATAAGFEPSFASALAAALGAQPPTRAERVYFRAPQGESPAIRMFAAHSLPALPRQWFDGAVVLIGADLPNQDAFRTPLTAAGVETLPGVAIHAQALAQLLDGSRYPAVAMPVAVALVLLASAVGVLLPFLRLPVILQAVAGIALLAAYWVLAVVWFVSGGNLLPLLAPTLGLLLAVTLGNAYARRAEERDKRFIRETFRRYVSPAVIEEMLANPRKLALGGEKREMSFVFSDLEGFTTLSEKLEPEDAVAVLQNYLDGMLKIALALGGTVDRLVGDGIAVFFGAPAAQPDHARRAVRCALEWDRYSEEFRREQRSKGLPLGITRIGVHTGTAVVGNVGSTDRFHYTAHGDCVNTAARLEGVNRHLGTRVCMSAEVARAHPADDLLPVGQLVLKGRSATLECVTFGWTLPPEAAPRYREAYSLLDSDAARSAALLAELCSTTDHGLLHFHRRRLERGESGSRIVLEAK